MSLSENPAVTVPIGLQGQLPTLVAPGEPGIPVGYALPEPTTRVIDDNGIGKRWLRHPAQADGVRIRSDPSLERELNSCVSRPSQEPAPGLPRCAWH